MGGMAERRALFKLVFYCNSYLADTVDVYQGRRMTLRAGQVVLSSKYIFMQQQRVAILPF